MKRYMLSVMVALAAIALVLLPSVANAQEAAFKAELTPYAVTITGGPHNERVTEYTGYGTHLGQCTAEKLGYGKYGPDPARWVTWGSMTITASNGDLLYLDHATAFTGTEWVGTFDICGGTGRFIDASGTGGLVVVINYTSAPTWCFDGDITF